MQKNEQTFVISDEKSLDKIIFPLEKGDRIFFYWDLGAGKTTFIRALLKHHFENENLIVRSPTYTYYQEYSWKNAMVHHFDLYRLEDFETFYLIGGMEIVENPESIILIEWPEILWESIFPTKIITITYDAQNNSRTINIKTQK